ncbi:MAG: molybdenum cofactor biosysynthesis protein [Verrucomicrobiota bacterium]
MKVKHCYISPDHNYVGHFGGPSGDTPIVSVDSVECVAGSGIRGDRFFDHKPDFKGQITFFAMETHEGIVDHFHLPDLSPAVYRRNVITEGIDLNDWIGVEFEVQGIKFVGTEEAKPCFWMNEAVCEGAEEALKGRGGLRAKILSSGTLRLG